MKKGFTYIETIIALAVFSIALLPLLTMLTVAYRNAEFSREAYIGQLQAQRIMTAARDAAASGEDIAERIADLENLPENYSIWCDGLTFISGENSLGFTPSAASDIPGDVITVLCWKDGGEILGRASCIVPEYIPEEDTDE